MIICVDKIVHADIMVKIMLTLRIVMSISWIFMLMLMYYKGDSNGMLKASITFVLISIWQSHKPSGI